MIIRAFTGPTHMTPKQRDEFREWFHQMLPAAEIRSGCAYGLDTLAADCYLEAEWAKTIHLFVPAAHHNTGLVKDMKDVVSPELLVITKCERGSTIADSYRTRNNWMIQGRVMRDILPATELCAVLMKPTFYRSGEWMTVNIAKFLGIKIKKLII